jgi:Divergent polysaccharide deacetylase
LELAIKIAQKQGGAIAIGHPYPETLKILEELVALDPRPVELVLVSELLANKEANQTLNTTQKEPQFCPIEIQYSPSMTSPFVIEQYLNLPSPSHKNTGFVIKKI